jgi:hypothetical protein
MYERFKPDIWRHVVTNSFYRVLFLARASTNIRLDEYDVVYMSMTTGEVCTREAEEFLDFDGLKIGDGGFIEPIPRFEFVADSLPRPEKKR